MNSNPELESVIDHLREERGIEYKASLSWNDTPSKEKIISSTLAFSNIPDGGIILIGVSKTESDGYSKTGMSKADWDSYDQDNVQEKANEFADPYVNVKVSKIEYGGLYFVAIQVTEFSEIPVVCKKNGIKLARGQVYTRPMRKIETVVIPSQTEMREILDLALEKHIRKLQALGLIGISSGANSKPDDSKNFEDQLGGL